MTTINRRHLLKSVAGGAAVVGISQAISEGAFAAPGPDALSERAARYHCWYLPQQGGQPHEQHAIDFWSMPWAVVRYESYLPPQIARALIAYEDFPRPIDSTDKALDRTNKPLEAFIEASKFYDRDWLDPATLDRFTAEPAVGSKDFQSMLTSFVGEKDTSTRNALLAIDSTTCGLGWHEMRSAFASCYNSTVGLKHIGERGFAQEKRNSRNCSESDFVRAFLPDTSPCDTVIVTSSGLFEIDAGLCPRASTEELVGELVRRLSYALMEPKILERIVGPPRTKSKPRFFALGSATLNATFEPLLHLQMMLDRQGAFVSASFAPLATDDLPLFITTSGDDDVEQRGVMDVLVRAASISGYALGPDMFATVQAPRYQPDTRRPGALDLIALWPFTIEA